MTVLTSEQLHYLHKFLKTLSKNQLIWVSGYVWGLVNCYDSKNFDQNFIEIIKSDRIKSNNNSNIEHNIVTIIFASQTGNARNIAEQLYNDIKKIGSDVVLYNARDYDFKKISKLKLLIFITSTHGDGEPPEEAISLYKYLFAKKAPQLKNINFAVLSLGDRSYEAFAKAGKDFDTRLEELGGYRLCDRIDVEINCVNEINTWKQKIVSIIKSDQFIVSKSYNQSNYIKTQKVLLNNVRYTKESPLVARLLNKQKITSCTALKDVHHLEIDITGSNICYIPGDSLGVWYENDPDLISELLNIMNLTGQELVEYKGKQIILNDALKKYYELTQNHPFVLQNIAIISKDKNFLNLLNDQKKLSNFIVTTSLIDMIKKASIKLSPVDLLKILRPMKPRFYSISSAQSEVGDEIHITVSVVRYKSNGCIRSGGASSYLVDRLQEDDELRVFIEPNNNFRLPKDPTISIIMIGAGTGIAPFRAFMQQRMLDRSIGRNWLFFGNLRFIDDFLYQTEWQNYVKLGVLNRIDTAWSRDQDNKIYVQDKLLQNSTELWDWIQSGAYVYVCGDAKRMACDVNKALILLTSQYGKMNLEKSKEYWDNMRNQHRYQRDIY